MRIFISAGESSGEQHAAAVARELRAREPGVELVGLGGPRMRLEGVRLLHTTDEIAIVGFTEVLRHLPFLRRVERDCIAEFDRDRPDVVLLVDYPGLNLRLARAAARRGIRAIYYISPQVWAWAPGRVRKMKGVIDRMLVLFPFELEIYRREGIPVECVGHPLMDTPTIPAAAALEPRAGLDRSARIVVLPGSRAQEVRAMLPIMIDAAELLARDRTIDAAVGQASVVDPTIYSAAINGRSTASLRITLTDADGARAGADAAMVKSGTSTLETAIAGVPMVVAYRTSLVTYLIGRTLASVDTIALVNIVAGRRVVPELVQRQLTPDRLATLIARLLDDRDANIRMRAELARVREMLGGPGAAARVAEVVMQR